MKRYLFGRWRSRFDVWRTLLFSMLVLVSSALYAASDQATDDAFSALLSMPGAEPESGRWDFPVPNDFGRQSETELIAYLANKKKTGADFNAYRHFGTLLHHAIRSGYVETAMWLVKNGADPRKTLKGGTENALDLSTRFGQKDLVRLLQDRYGMKAKPTAKAVPATVDPGERDPADLPTDKLSPSVIDTARKILERTALSASYTNQTTSGAQFSKTRIEKWNAFVSRISADDYARLMDDDTAVANLVRINAGSAKNLDKALSSLPPDLLKRRADAVAGALAMTATVEVGAGTNLKRKYFLSSDSWRVLWRHAGRSIAYPDGLPLAGRVQPELWAELFSTGYSDRNAESALGCLVTEISASDLAAIWPQLETRFPNLRDAAPRMVLNHFRMPAGNYCWAWSDDETAKKLNFLNSLGIRSPVKGIIKQSLENRPAGLISAMKPFLPSAKNGNSPFRPRLTKAEHKCSFKLTDAWYQELLKNFAVFENVPIETVQLIDIPGENECGLLVGGFAYVSSAPNDSFSGPEENPVPSCPDPVGGYKVVRVRQGMVERLNTEIERNTGGTDLTPVLDTVTGRRYYLRDEGGSVGMCDGRRRLPMLYGWHESSTGTVLKQVMDWELEGVLFDQCQLGDDSFTIVCDEIYDGRPSASPVVSMYSVMDYQAFLKTFRAEQYEDYQSAILMLDKPKLTVIQSMGIPGVWTADAIKRIGKSGLSLEEKRKRTAWIFYDNAQLARALSNDVMIGLLDWLPREDWQPILRVISKYNYNVGDLRGAAQKKGLTRLACDIDHAQGLICGETWTTSR